MRIDSILLVENERVDYLYPFSIMHSAWEVRCGALMLFEKIKKEFPKSRFIYKGRQNHIESFYARFGIEKQTLNKENILIINSALLPDKAFWNKLKLNYEDFIKDKDNDKIASFIIGNSPVAAFIPKIELDKIKDINNFIRDFFNKSVTSYPQIEMKNGKIINYLWDAIEFNGVAINDDCNYFISSANLNTLVKKGVFLINKNKIIIDKSAKIAPTVVIDASEGNVIIDKNVRILPQSSIFGPCYIGENTIIKAGAKIYGKTSIGNTCKVGGEVENSIIQSNTNKQHEGFLGHSYLGEWVNIGAGTNTSDLKNTYSPISVQLDKTEIDTERTFLGLLCGDHTKTAINTAFTTGTVAGICGIIVADGFLPRYIPSFAWRGTKGCSYYKLDKAIETIDTSMKRRNKKLLPEELKLIKEEFNKVSE